MNIAIVGTGPTGIYTFYALLQQDRPLAVTLYEQGDEAGVGMPYSDDDTTRFMLANIASIEIPPLYLSYLDWLRQQDEQLLSRFQVTRGSLHDRQFLPRLLLGHYFRDQFLRMVEEAGRRGFAVTVHESCRVTDIAGDADGVTVAAEDTAIARFDRVVVATGHVWPEDTASRSFFPSPWSGLIEAEIPACPVGIMGTSLSGIDAAMAVAAQHGRFASGDNGEMAFILNPESTALHLTLMSRSGILPEADFYCPLPYEPLQVVTDAALENEIARGASGLLDRIYRLIAQEIAACDPQWSAHIGLSTLTPDTFRDAWFADREQHDPFRWAEYNLDEVEANKRNQVTVAWRYAILRLHEAIEPVVPHLTAEDRRRFDSGLARVFIDNYAAIPSQSIRRLLALRHAGLLALQTLGDDYEMNVEENGTTITTATGSVRWPVFIDARGQKPLKTRDIPFPTLRRQLTETGEEMPDIGDDYTLQQPASLCGRIAFAALPWLMHDRPFVQGIVASAEIGASIARCLLHSEHRLRRKLPWVAE